MKLESRRKSSTVGEFIARVYDVYFPGDQGHYGTDAEPVLGIPGDDFPADSSTYPDKAVSNLSHGSLVE